MRPAKKGECRNPRGRPKKDYDLAALAQKHAEAAIKTLVDVMANPENPPAPRVAAASELLDRGFGRAPASLDVKHTLSFSEEFEGFMRSVLSKNQPQTIDAVEVHAIECEDDGARTG